MIITVLPFFFRKIEFFSGFTVKISLLTKSFLMSLVIFYFGLCIMFGLSGEEGPSFCY